ncbi:hypothetical protein E2C01_030489 [Portunus trituberculatus]|uniref:Uncharacterized protein n=1 Tax=Portunus trituberculatus TaxID=210409 RepID=A0A5B7EUX5_PORTR|nr:hypothetical protein [Portunus trituberculatus]
MRRHKHPLIVMRPWTVGGRGRRRGAGAQVNEGAGKAGSTRFDGATEKRWAVDRLFSRLFGFLPQRSIHHCLADLYSRLSRDSVVAFVDLKSAFDVSNRDIILDQLADFGIKGNLLQWIRSYRSNRTS